MAMHRAVPVPPLPNKTPLHSLSARQAWQISTEFFGVPVQVFFAGSQERPKQADSSLTVHCTHVPAFAPASLVAADLQMAVLDKCEQSVFVEQGSQVPLIQADAATSVQSVTLRHPTQIFLEVSQSGVAPEQLLLLMH
jgi:hypothetical protein